MQIVDYILQAFVLYFLSDQFLPLTFPNFWFFCLLFENEMFNFIAGHRGEMATF